MDQSAMPDGHYWKRDWVRIVALVLGFRLIYSIPGLMILRNGGPAHFDAPIYYEMLAYLHSGMFARQFVNPWFQWDTIGYLKIALSGYSNNTGTAFMPLYPLLIRFSTPLFAGDSLLAGLILSTVFCASALVLLYELVRRYGEARNAFMSVIAMLLFPTAFFLLAGYTESLFLTLVLACWHLALRRRWFWAALLASLATLTRIQGVVLTPIMCWMILTGPVPSIEQSPRQQLFHLKNLFSDSISVKSSLARNRLGWAYAFLPIGVALGYQLWLKAVGFMMTADSLITGWGIRVVPPWAGFSQFIQRLTTTNFIYMDWIDLLLLIFVLTLSIIGLRRLDMGFSLYIWLTLAIFFMRGSTPHILASFSRYFLALFPLFLLIPRITRPILRALILEVSFGLQMLLLWIFLSGSWVA